LVSVSENLEQENRRFYADAHAMVQHIEHMRDIISLQQVHGRTSAFKESVDLASLMEHALLLDGDILLDAELTIERNYADVPPLLLSKNLLLQILVNLISNARHAVSAAGISERRVTLGISPPTDGRVVLSVADTGCGITESNLGKIFTHGFTTRKEGNGFGLHHACLLAEEMGGMLKAESAGRNQGATFYLTLPATEGPRTTNRNSATGQLKAQLPALHTQPV
jgi:signal transduction histidine kinase